MSIGRRSFIAQLLYSFMASLPGFPGNLGLPPSGNPANSDVSLDLPGKSSGPAIVNRTVFSSPTFVHGSITIPPTTAGNTLVVVSTSAWWESFAVFNGVIGGYPTSDTSLDPVNTASDGFDGGNATGLGNNSGAQISYFTNIAGGITTVDFPALLRGSNCGAIPTMGVVYELTPSPVIAIFSTADSADIPTSPPTLIAEPISGPPAGGFYITCIAYYQTGLGPLSGSFTGVNSPWTIDFQGIDPGDDEAGAIAIIDDATGTIGGTQQAIFTWIGGANPPTTYGATCISLLPSRGTSTPSGGIFQPNVFVVC